MSLMPDPDFEQRVGAVRRFSRFYTRRIGLLQDGLLETPFSLTQGRVLYELAHRRDCTATDVAASLGLDHGYLSRILRNFEQQGLVAKRRGKEDGRQWLLSLTTKGHKVFAALDHRSQDDVITSPDRTCARSASRIDSSAGGVSRRESVPTSSSRA